MDYNLSEEHRMIRETVRQFAEREIRPLARELDEKETFSPELTRKMGELGLFGIYLPEKYGGQGMDYLAYIIAVEEIARVDGSQAATLAAHNSLGIGPLYYYGSEEQKMKYLPMLCTGEALWAFGLTEPDAGSDSRGSKTRATLENGEWVINGSKIFITNGSADNSMGATVQAVTGEKQGKKEFTTILVDKDTPGFTRQTMHGKMMWRASDTSQLFFDDCRVPESNLLGKVGEGSKIMLSTLDSGRLSIAAMGLGCAQGAYELALNYAKERKQFGQPISKFQAIAFKLADMAMKIELARNLLYKACWLKDTNQPFAMESAMAKLYCSEIAREVADEAVQVHGGYGLMKDYEIERFYRDQRLLQIGEGTSEIQRLVISRYIGC
ncbi:MULTISPECIES: acyl-CoA dehydrogenase family protein [Lentimicrobium]|jgi:alkylation response protein AidB-like acyl-CoA dehydrogenase|uniref:Cyclohexane-1-carbonyl-CoA dehydrogenase n=1 Tax=Lentimicrobium saccharophilum TaxID=1678841 RepID=A0A0S7C1W8_9BACT|nr:MULTISPECIES: acyl-CoA dehydrogenase family protein [Lentimicrobium]MCO5263867.1 acyl-CoA dehydrogenase family protein [Lentimicrobium sp.]GAP44110.1 acyl-CoA dehydrogenase related to the alkylation response protein AidB [Lentimicrobium saccharophilum]HPR27548.1 acyl-CoA dehydrogenase family protein [Lentimicrobium sp.]